MRQTGWILWLMVIGSTCLRAQPPICMDPPTMTSTCQEACVICDIDGFTGRHESDVPGVAPPGFCTFIVHNAQWIAFVAGSEDLIIELSVSNCDMGFGLEIGIYEGIDCGNFRLVSNCRGGTNTPITGGSSGLLSNTEPLVVGQYYYLVMDGAFGDNCDWTFRVVEGSTELQPLTTSGPIDGPSTSCPEVVERYTSPGVPGGTEYDWTLNGQPIGAADSVDVSWPGPGAYQLCLTVSNACDQAAPTCRTISVAAYPEVVHQAVVCANECYVLNDSITLCETGLWEYNFVTEQGCDSLVTVDLTVYESPILELAAIEDALRRGG